MGQEPDAIDPLAAAENGGQDHLGCGYWSEENDAWKTDGMALGALGVDPDTKAAMILCTTYHLSAFASREESTTPLWDSADLFIGVSVFAKVSGCEKPERVACNCPGVRDVLRRDVVRTVITVREMRRVVSRCNAYCRAVSGRLSQ